MKTKAVLLATSLATSVLVGVWGPAASAQSASCDDVPSRPWEGASADATDQNAADDVLAKLAADSDVGWAMSWYTQSGDATILHVGVAGSDEAANAIIQENQLPKGMDIQTDKVPYSYDQLEATQSAVDDYLTKLGIVFSSEKRPDVGVIVVSMSKADIDKFGASVQQLGPPCGVALEESNAAGSSLMISRLDQPPYKAGKEVRILNAVETNGCTSGFVFKIGSTLYGSMSGHCNHTAGRTVQDMTSSHTFVGTTVSPNTFGQPIPRSPMASFTT